MPVSKRHHISTEQVRVKLPYGTIEGEIEWTKSAAKMPYFSFKGIPYGDPPIGESRFKPAQPPKSWTEIKDVKKFRDQCAQWDEERKKVMGSEDCLYLNIFTKSLKKTALKPVIFVIHGGDFIKGNASTYGPDFLLEQDFVVVTFNYRIGILGFFTAMHENALGNCGLKDQLLALNWVHQNITLFGGDKDNVTLYGSGSGAFCVFLHVLHPKSKGKFKRIACNGASSLNPRYLQRNPMKYTHLLAQNFDCDNKDEFEEMIEEFQKLNVKKLLEAASDPKVMGYKEDLGPKPFYPIIEISNESSFLESSPYQLLADGKFHPVDYLVGFNSNEGSLGFELANNKMNIRDFDTNNALWYPTSLNQQDDKDIGSIGQTCRDYFMKDSSVTAKKEDFLRFLGEHLVTRGILKELEFYKDRSNKEGYLYKFSYKGTNTTKLPGAGHGEEEQYIFFIENPCKADDSPENMSEKDVKTKKRICKILGNFARTGKPLKESLSCRCLFDKKTVWQPITERKKIMLNIGEKVTSEEVNLEDYNFWNDLFTNHGEAPLINY